MVSETTSAITLLGVIIVGVGLLCYGMFLSAGQSVNAPSIAGGVIVLAGLAAMLYVSVRVFEQQETSTSH